MKPAKKPSRRLLGTPRLVPVKNPALQLQQAARVLKLIEAVGRAADLGVDGRELMKAMKFARKLVEQVIAKLVADQRAKGGVR